MNEKQKLEIEELKLHGVEYLAPVLTDPYCSRYIVGVKNDPTYYIFSQYEIVDPENKEMKLRTETLNLDDYSESERDSACEAFGVDVTTTDSALVAKCLFRIS